MSQRIKSKYKNLLAWIAAIPVVLVLIWYPEWSIAMAFVIAVVAVFWPDDEDVQLVDSMESVRFLALCALTMFGIELSIWFVAHRDTWPFRDVVFPTASTPIDFRLAFAGWTLLFMAILEYIKYKIIDAQYPCE